MNLAHVVVERSIRSAAAGKVCLAARLPKKLGIFAWNVREALPRQCFLAEIFAALYFLCGFVQQNLSLKVLKF